MIPGKLFCPATRNYNHAKVFFSIFALLMMAASTPLAAEDAAPVPAKRRKPGTNISVSEMGKLLKARKAEWNKRHKKVPVLVSAEKKIPEITKENPPPAALTEPETPS